MPHLSSIRILSVDDHALAIEGIAAMIRMHRDMELVSHAQNGGAAVRSYQKHRPDVTLMDLQLPDMSGIEALTLIRSEFSEAKVIMLTMSEGDVSIKSAARGYLLKSTPPAAIVEAIREVHAGKMCLPSAVAGRLAEHLIDEPLSEREIEVLKHVAGGISNRDIGTLLFISEATVKAHIKRFMGKLGAHDRTQAVTVAVRRGIIHF